MGELIHIAEIAALLFVAYSAGWGLGYGARRVVSRRMVAAVPAIPAERLATARGDSVGDTVAAAVPAGTATVVVFEQSLASLERAIEGAPAPVEGPAETAAWAALSKASAEPAPAPLPALPATSPGLAWSGERKGQVSPLHDAEIVATPPSDGTLPESGGWEPPAIEFPLDVPRPATLPPPEAAEPLLAAALDPVPESVPLPLFADVIPPAFAVPAETMLAPAPQSAPAVVPTEPVAAEPIAPPPALASSPALAVATDAEPAPLVQSAAPSVVPETVTAPAAEMSSAVPPPRSADRPELIDVTAAVAAAQNAVHQVLANTAGERSTPRPAAVGRPAALPGPRGGNKDNLRWIEGITPLDEATLNNLGIYHFDQIAALSDVEVLWLENHAFARGRIGRETWQPQARALQASSGIRPGL